MKESQKSLVLATVPVLRESGVALTTYFYQRMLKHNPELVSELSSMALSVNTF